MTLEVTDVNGLTTTASVALPGDGSVAGGGVPGGGGFGKLAIGPIDVGIEQTVDEWQCAQDSAIGFKALMGARGIPTAFDWRGWAAFEKDFKDVSQGRLGHGATSTTSTPSGTRATARRAASRSRAAATTSGSPRPTRRWGDWDLEWLQLESCQVLADTNGSHDYFSRWGGTMDGLHMLNGFHTNAYCIDGGTGGRFADYLFPSWWRGPRTVRNAWAQMAIDKEPTGVVYRSMGNLGSGWVNQHRRLLLGPGPDRPGHPAQPPDRDVVDHRNRVRNT